MECKNVQLGKEPLFALHKAAEIADYKKSVSMRWYCCPLCENKEFETAYAQPSSLVKVSPHIVEWKVIISICKKCGLVQSNPRPSPKNIARLYRPSLAHISAENISTKPSDPKGQSLKWRAEQVSFIKKIRSLKPKAKILDIGCNNGFVPAQLKKAGFDAIGVEPNLTCAVMAQNRGLLVATTFYQNALFMPKSFDLISAFHVLEHTNNPYDFLTKAHSELKSTGYLCLEVPDLENTYSDNLDDFFTYHHLYYFTHTSLNAMLKKAGFVPVEIETTSYRAFRVLAKKCEPHLEFDAGEVNKARKLMESYRTTRRRILDDVSEKIEKALGKLKGKKRVVVWGAGKHSYEILRLTPLKKHVDLLFVDSDQQKQANGFLGYRVFSPDALVALAPELVIVGTYQFQKELEAELKKMGFAKKKILTLYNDVRVYDGI